MNTALSLAMIAVAVIVLISALLALATFASSITGGAKRTTYWSKVFAGTSYSCLAVDGLLCLGFLREHQLLTGILAVLFLLLGVWLIRSGLKQRRASIGSS